jgi:exopolysaccharide/PEP-CTERM locus tyrosine autokinase
MSLIEQAAKRLEQLQRAGVEVPGHHPAIEKTPQESAAATASTTEAAVRALEERQETASPLIKQARPAPAETGRADTRSKRISIDVERLGARGFVTPNDATSQLASEYRLIKRPLLENINGRSATPVAKANMIMITSAMPGEGKTFTSINLAMSMAFEIDHTVLLVDADVTRPNVMASLGLDEAPGLMDVLLNPKLDLADVLQLTNVEKLTLLPAGSSHARATELLASEIMVNLVNDLATRYPDRIVIFDAPPLLATTESRVLARHMGQVVVVVEADHTTHGTLNDALETVKSCPVVATVLNKAARSDVGGYGYGYGYGSGSRSGSGQRRKEDS